MGLITDLTAVANEILGVRDSIGAAIHTVNFVTRTWSGTEVGDGTATDVSVLMVPSPGLQDLSHKYALLSGGNYRQGDIILKSVSKQSYPARNTVDLANTGSKLVEKFYSINGELYNVVNVKESYITWDIQIRKLAP